MRYIYVNESVLFLYWLLALARNNNNAGHHEEKGDFSDAREAQPEAPWAFIR